MRATTIRFTSDLWELLEREARREGVSVAQYVRDAAMFRAAFGLGERSPAREQCEPADQEPVSLEASFGGRRQIR